MNGRITSVFVNLKDTIMEIKLKLKQRIYYSKQQGRCTSKRDISKVTDWTRMPHDVNTDKLCKARCNIRMLCQAYEFNGSSTYYS